MALQRSCSAPFFRRQLATAGSVPTARSRSWRPRGSRRSASSASSRPRRGAGRSSTKPLPGALTTTLPNAAIIGFTKIMAADLGSAGITVSNICPGFTSTKSWGPRAEAMAKVRNTTADAVRKSIADMTMLGRWAEPEEIGTVAAFLVSERNTFVTGTTVEVCGGFAKYL